MSLTVTKEINLATFSFWSGAAEHKFTYTELESLECVFEDSEDLTETYINDLFWFEEEWLCEYIGIDYDNDYLER